MTTMIMLSNQAPTWGLSNLQCYISWHHLLLLLLVTSSILLNVFLRAGERNRSGLVCVCEGSGGGGVTERVLLIAVIPICRPTAF